ncbi:TBC1 domain family member 5 [Nematostella vectensis]|uniref:TBC1 domain family member 5 n=1 Tax=Nematostella vectensis TaxID=45351 RepID=UPI0020776A2E|nr:TBC1 domain family member 5 [Nematostella vectensis]
MERQEFSPNFPSSVSSQDIHDALDAFGGPFRNQDTISSKKASNRDSGVSESSFVSDHLTFTSDSLLNEIGHANQMPISHNKTSDDPLGASHILSASAPALSFGLGADATDNKGPNSRVVNATSPWDEAQNLLEEWNKLFSSSHYLSDLKAHALNGKLRLSKFRSVAWKLFLECLPEKQESWLSTSKQHREEYISFKSKCIIDPNKIKETSNMETFHPLSQEEDSPWKKFFKDNELKAIILRDLERLYPENPYFHTERVRDMMLNILFCHAKKNETLGYKQGMHELLAPLIHVLDTDSRMYRYLDGNQMEMTKAILDPLYIEHDAFMLFSQVMDATETWYHHYQPHPEAKQQQLIDVHAAPFKDPTTTPVSFIFVNHFIRLTLLNRHLFYHPYLLLLIKLGKSFFYTCFARQVAAKSVLSLDMLFISHYGDIFIQPTAIVKKLNKIQDHLLRKHDTDLWLHLKDLDIAPQLYGLRWIRLLFSREFPFPDFLVLWDALFAEGTHLDLVDYIYIGMLHSIRNKLMAGNYNSCLGHLMKFPRTYEDIHSYVKRAVAMREPKTKKSRPHSRVPTRPAPPPPSSSSTSTAPGVLATDKTLAAVDHMPDSANRPGHMIRKGISAIRRPQSALASINKRHVPFSEPKTLALSHRSSNEASVSPPYEELVQQCPDARTLSPPGREPRERSDSVGPSTGRAMKSLSNELKTKLIRPRTRSRTNIEELEKDHQRLQEQVSNLNSKVESMEGMFLYCGRKMDSYIGLMQDEIMKDDRADRDVVFLTLAGLKQVRDLLKGSLAFRGSSIETECDFVDIDKGIASRLQTDESNLQAQQPLSDAPVPNDADYHHYENDEMHSSSKPETIMFSSQIHEDSATLNPIYKGDMQEPLETQYPTHIEQDVDSVTPNSFNGNKEQQPLEAYFDKLTEHERGSIPVVACAVGPIQKSLDSRKQLTPSDLIDPDDLNSEFPDSAGVSVSINNIRFLLENQNPSALSGGGQLDGFVFVDRDGKAQEALTILPTHPLEFSESDTDDE